MGVVLQERSIGASEDNGKLVLGTSGIIEVSDSDDVEIRCIEILLFFTEAIGDDESGKSAALFLLSGRDYMCNINKIIFICSLL